MNFCRSSRRPALRPAGLDPPPSPPAPPVSARCASLATGWANILPSLQRLSSWVGPTRIPAERTSVRVGPDDMPHRPDSSHLLRSTHTPLVIFSGFWRRGRSTIAPIMRRRPGDTEWHTRAVHEPPPVCGVAGHEPSPVSSVAGHGPPPSLRCRRPRPAAPGSGGASLFRARSTSWVCYTLPRPAAGLRWRRPRPAARSPVALAVPCLSRCRQPQSAARPPVPPACRPVSGPAVWVQGGTGGWTPTLASGPQAATATGHGPPAGLRCRRPRRSGTQIWIDVWGNFSRGV